MRSTLALGQLRSIKYQLLGIVPLPRSRYYPSAESWSETDTLQYLRQTRVLAQSIIRQLSQMTDLLQPHIPVPRTRAQLCNADELPAALGHTPRELRLSGELRATSSFLPRLTEYDYGPKQTEQISRLLYSVLRPDGYLNWDCAAFNSVIGYFLAINDLHMALHTVKIMLGRGIKPDRATLHLVLRFQARRVAHNPYPIGVLGHPLIYTQQALQGMDQAGVRADAETWNLVLQCMPFGFGKSFLVEEMDRRAIPLNSDSRRAILETVIKDRASEDSPQPKGSNADSKRGVLSSGVARGLARSPDIPQVLLEALDPSDPKVLRLLVDYMLSRKTANNDNVKYAWQLMETSRTPGQHLKSTEMLNVWLRRFAARRHLDWQFGILQFFKHTPWNADSWQYLLEAAAFCAERPQKYVVLGTILKQAERERVPLTSRARYLARRGLRKRPRRFDLRDLGQEGLERLKRGLAWTSVLEPSDPTLLATIGFASEGTPLTSMPVDNLDIERFAAVPRTDETGAARNVVHAAFPSAA